MAIEGTLDLFQLPEILQLISHQGKTGILTVQGDADIVAISFERGRVVAADALNQTLEEALGEVLAGQGLVGPADFATVAAAHRVGQGRLMDLLVARGLLTRQQLLGALRLHTYRLLLELLGWRAGDFKFYSGEEVSYEEGFSPIAVEELLIRSVEEAAGEGHPTIPDSRSIYEPVEPAPPIFVRRDGEEPPTASGMGIWLTVPDKELLDQMSGGYTVSALVKKVGGDEYKVRYTLHRLLEAGAIRRRSATTILPAIPPPPVELALPALEPPASAHAFGEPSEAPLAPPLAPPRPTPRPAERERLSERLTSRAGWGFALLPALLALFCLARAPLFLALPLPWDRPHRLALERDLANSGLLKVDRAAKAHYLLHDRFPDQLGTLVAMGALTPRDLRDPLGRLLVYGAQPTSYTLGPEAAEEVEGEGRIEGVSGNFLLDPDFLSLPKAAKQPPLVLLD